MIYIAFLLVTVFILGVAFYQWQYFMVFAPTYYREDELDDRFTILSVTTDDKTELEGVVYEPEDPHVTILFFAGRNHDSVGMIKKLSLNFPHHRIVTFNYRSYGKSKGVVNEQNMFSDGVEIAKLIQKNYGNFYICGFSIGSSVASYVASKVAVSGLFLIGTFDSILGLAKSKFGIDFSWLYRYRFETFKFVQKVNAKTYIFVSKDDEIAYIQNARELQKHVKNLEFYKEFDNLTHKELLWHKEVIDKINGVLR